MNAGISPIKKKMSLKMQKYKFTNSVHTQINSDYINIFAVDNFFHLSGWKN